MPFTLIKFQSIRPYLYHLTDQRNIERIRSTGRLLSATRLLRAAKQPNIITAKRAESIPITVDGDEVWIRDQRPLHAGNAGLQNDWTFKDLVRMLNEKVFFWPGSSSGPISYGVRHYERYAFEKPALLRLNSSRIVAVNAKNIPLFCRYNSGSPRWSNGIASPRGPSTFVSCADADFSAAAVVECVFREEVILPACVELGSSFSGPWKPLFSKAGGN